MVKAPAVPLKTVPLKTILLVEDADGKRLTRKWLLGSLGYAVDAVRSAEEALILFKAETHDVVVAATTLPGMTGPELAQVIKMRSPSTPVLLCTAGPACDDHSCVDAVVPGMAHVQALVEALERLLAAAG